MTEPSKSSRGIEEAFSNGNAREIIRSTGEPYRLTGVVTEGRKLGRTLGFPTANLTLSDDTPFRLAPGVYAVMVVAEGAMYQGMANAGFRPTLGGTTLIVEVNLFGFSGDLYGKTLEVLFMDRIRAEKKFNGIEELSAQIALDRDTALRLLG